MNILLTSKYLNTWLLLLILVCVFMGFWYTHEAPAPTKIPVVFEFSTDNKLPIILVTINGLPASLLIDSGASVSSIDSKFSNHYNFEADSAGIQQELSGLGGTVIMKGISHIDIMYQDSLLTHPFKTTDLGRLYETTGSVGIIGSDYLIANQIIIDYAKGQLVRGR